MNLKDCYERARVILRGLDYPTNDAITPIERSLIRDLNSTAEYFAINFVGYLLSTKVMVKKPGAFSLNKSSLDNLDFNSFKTYLEDRRKNGLLTAVNPLYKLLQES